MEPPHRRYQGKMYDMYRRQKKRSIHRKHPPPTYSKEEFYAWCEANGYAIRRVCDDKLKHAGFYLWKYTE